jgi:hypothetical protein
VDRIFAPGEESLHALDQIVMVDGRVADDEAGLDAIRRWLFAGGHLWVMLDHVDSRVLELILGDDISCEVIDRVGLTTVRIASADQDASRRSTQDHERPVDFVRVAVSGVQVAYTVDGWPAAFWKSYGNGSLLVTTLAPRGWLRPRTEADNAPAAPPILPPGAPGPPRLGGPGLPPPPAVETKKEAAEDQGEFVVVNPMKGLASKFFSLRPPTPLPPATLAPLVEEYVGYSIPPRWLIASLLSGLGVTLAVLAVFLARQSRPETLGWAGPGMAVAVSVVLALLGRQQRIAIPETVASLQFVEPVPGTGDVRVQGIVGLFSSEGGAARIASRRAGWIMPDMTGLEGATRRMVWTDLDDWQWENFPNATALRTATLLAPGGDVTERIEANATFGPSGVEGHLQLGARHAATDAILATREGRIGVQFQRDGKFVARDGDVLAPGQFLPGGLWTDEQNRRARIIEMLLTSQQRPDFPSAPQLLFWTGPWDLGFEFDAGRNSLGAALVAVPVHWERPSPGTRVTIPVPLLPYRAAVGPDGLEPAAMWDPRNRSWQEKSAPSATWLRFQVPLVLLPIEVERARVVLNVTGPVGKLEIAGQRNNNAVPLKTWIDPLGQLSLEITQTELLPISRDGGLLLRISGGDPDRPELTHTETDSGPKTNYWRILSLALELDVKTAVSPNSQGEDGGAR